MRVYEPGVAGLARLIRYAGNRPREISAEDTGLREIEGPGMVQGMKVRRTAAARANLVIAIRAGCKKEDIAVAKAFMLPTDSVQRGKSQSCNGG